MSEAEETSPVDVGPLTSEWITLEQLAGDRFDVAEAYFAAAVAGTPGLDRRGQGAYFIGTVAYYLAEALVRPVLTGGAAPALNARNFAVSPAGADGMDLRYRVSADAGPTEQPIGEIVERAIAGLVNRVKAETRLAEPAQWRLVADGIASATLYLGEERGCRAEGQALGLAVVRDPRFKPFNGLTGYVEVDGHAFLKRGGCCRYYTADEGSYCATCILRDPDEQIVELKRYLAEEMEG
jgi:hypothetical protein